MSHLKIIKEMFNFTIYALVFKIIPFPPSKLPYFLKIKSELSGTEQEFGGQPYTTVTFSDPEIMSSGRAQNAMT